MVEILVYCCPKILQLPIVGTQFLTLILLVANLANNEYQHLRF